MTVAAEPSLNQGPKATGLNVPLLRAIQKHILEVPNRLIMDDLVNDIPPGESVYDGGVEFEAPACGTVACIAGWACLLVEGKEGWTSLPHAARLLGLDNVNVLKDRLFLTAYWPFKYKERWCAAKLPTQRAQIVSDLIDEVIATDGAILKVENYHRFVSTL